MCTSCLSSSWRLGPCSPGWGRIGGWTPTHSSPARGERQPAPCWDPSLCCPCPAGPTSRSLLDWPLSPAALGLALALHPSSPASRGWGSIPELRPLLLTAGGSQQGLLGLTSAPPDPLPSALLSASPALPLLLGCHLLPLVPPWLMPLSLGSHLLPEALTPTLDCWASLGLPKHPYFSRAPAALKFSFFLSCEGL